MSRCPLGAGFGRGLAVGSGLAGGDRQELLGECLNLPLNRRRVQVAVDVGEDVLVLGCDDFVSVGPPVWGRRLCRNSW